ncbi:MAG: MFS transporter [Candidatus Eremiobacteraeota bacterium]|nr:MFS transporter [Candidatus Eremiobacteraeota bacterium]MCW5866632.1 MFS transporter [Candidatus Eremiobacteraeota bacterium]
MSQSPGPSPLRRPLFRMLWVATIVSNIGNWIQEVSSTWLMATMAPDPLMVSLAQVASALPVFLLAIPAGALADVLDRRKLLIFTQAWMLIAAATMAVVTLMGMMNPWILLICTFYLAVGSALNSPGWHAITPEIVPKQELAAAVTLNGLGISCARAVGPGLAGLVLVNLGAGKAFLINSLSFLAVIGVLLAWRRKQRMGNLPAERFVSAMRVGAQHVRHSPVLRLVLVRSGIFVFTTSCLWSLLPLLCKSEYKMEAQGYGLLLVTFGMGSILTASFLLPGWRARYPANTMVSRAWLAYLPVFWMLAECTNNWLPYLVIFWAGGCQICILSCFHLAAQSLAPPWVRARAMSVYLLVYAGSAALGGLFWGYLARGLGLRSCLLLSSAVLFVSAVTAWVAPLHTGEGYDHDPSHHWEDPDVKVDIPLNHGPIQVVVEYDIAPEKAREFVTAMERLKRIRLRNGVLRWALYCDLAAPHRFREVYLEESWAAHLRQHERVSNYEAEVAAAAYCYHRGEEMPEVFHYGYCDERFPGKADEEHEDHTYQEIPLWFLD